MENIKGKYDDLNQKIRPGTTWVAGFTKPGNNDDLRSIDSDGSEMRFIPVSRYYASCKIKRGQALSIAQLNDLTVEQKQNKYAYVKVTDPDLDETCIGIAMSYAEEGQIVQIQSTGKFNYNTTESILYTEEAAEKEIFLNAKGWKFDNVRGQKLYIKKLYNNRTGAETTEDNKVRPSLPHEGIDQDENGDYFDTDSVDQSISADTDNWFTYDFLDSIYNVKNTIQIGYLTDAPTTNSQYYIKEDENWIQVFSDGTKTTVFRDAIVVEYDEEKKQIVTAEDITLTSTGVFIPKGSRPPKAHEAVWLQLAKEEDDIKYYSAVDDLTVTLELEITGDTRGPIDNTQFLLTLGETIYFDTKKQDVDLRPPHFNNGVYDELKVVAIAQGKPTGPCFRCFLTTDGAFAYEKAVSFEEGKVYYARYPGNVFKKAEGLTAAKFNNTFEAATIWLPEIEYYELNPETGKYASVGYLSVDAFTDSLNTYFYKLDYYTESSSLDYAFIGLRKVDGDTYIIPVLCNFTEEDLANGAALIDVNDEGYYKLTQQFNAGVEQEFFDKTTAVDANAEYYEFDETSNSFILTTQTVTAANVNDFYIKTIRKPKTILGEPLLSVSREGLKEAISKGLQNIFVNDETRLLGCQTVTYNIGDNGFQLLTQEFGGSYDIYVSSNLLSLITVTQVKHGQSAEPGTAILADIRDSDRLNVVGVVLSNQTGVHRAGETIKVMRIGRITTLGNLLPGQEYFLGLNGRITTRSQYWYDHCVPVGLAESANYFIVDVSQHPQRNYSGSFPLGYLKPSIYGMSEKGYILADGKTVYNKDEYPELYNLLLDWFNEEELKPSNVSEDLYNKYTNWSLGKVFTDIFNKLSAVEIYKGQVIDILKDYESRLNEFKEDLAEEKAINTAQKEQLSEIGSGLEAEKLKNTSQETDIENIRTKNIEQDEALKAEAETREATDEQHKLDLASTFAEALTKANEYTDTELAKKLLEALLDYVKAEDYEKKQLEQDEAIREAEESEDIEKLETDLKTDLEEAKTEIERLSNMNSQLEDDLQTANDKISTLENTLDSFAEKLSELEKKLEKSEPSTDPDTPTED